MCAGVRVSRRTPVVANFNSGSLPQITIREIDIQRKNLLLARYRGAVSEYKQSGAPCIKRRAKEKGRKNTKNIIYSDKTKMR